MTKFERIETDSSMASRGNSLQLHYTTRAESKLKLTLTANADVYAEDNQKNQFSLKHPGKLIASLSAKNVTRRNCRVSEASLQGV